MPMVSVKVSAAEMETWKKLAEEAGQGLSAYIRGKVNACPLPPEPVCPAVAAVSEQLDRIAEHETSRKKKPIAASMSPGGFQNSPACDNPRCSRLGVPLCAPCRAAASKAAPSAAETFETIV